MTILVLNQYPYDFFPYQKWLKEIENEILFLTSEKVGKQFNENNFLYLESFKKYDTALVDLRIMQLYKEYQFEKIIVLFEFDLLRVAKLRDTLGIKGQTFEHASLYRDKIKMKNALKKQGSVKLPLFCHASYPSDIVEFVEEHSFPIVIKPADSAGSLGTFVINEQRDLDYYLSQMAMSQMNSVQPAHHLIIEQFIAGEMYHVDGFIQNGEIKLICASKYLEKSLIYLEQNDISGSYMLSRENPLSQRLIKEAEKVLEAMPPTANMIFHAEFFHTPDDELVFCEIASRPGGAKIISMIEAAHDFHISEAYVRSECGLDYHSPTYMDNRVVGHVVPAPKNGKLVSAPTEIPYPWVLRYGLSTELGTEFHGAEDTSQYIAYIIVEASTEEELQERLYEANKWFEQACVWEHTD